MKLRQVTYKTETFNIFDPASEKYLAILNTWYKERDWHPIPASTTGVMVFDDIPICAGWLYSTDSAACLIGNIISCTQRVKNKKESIKKLLAKLEIEAKKKGFRTILFFMTVESISNIAQEEGYIKTDQVNELVKNIA